VPGDNANPGTSAAAPKRTLAGLDVNALPAGTQLLFARGGVWTNFNLQLRNLNATPTSPLVFDAYAPSWGGTAVPWIKAGGSFYAFQFGTFGDTANDGGYTLRNLKLDGLNSATAWGLHLRNDVRAVLFENLEITGFELGLHSQQTGTTGNAFTLRNSNIHHNSDMGMLGEGTDMVMEGNTFAANNFSGSAFSHAIYLGGHGRNGVIRNNTFTNNSVVNGACTGGNLTVHGQWDGLLIEGNTITQNASLGGCYGVAINPSYDTAEWFRNVVVRGNTIVNLGFVAIGAASAPGIVVENNLIVNLQPTYQAAILIPEREPRTGDAADTGAIVRNNTVYYAQPASGSEGVALRANSGASLQVVSNLVYLGAGASGTPLCFAHTALSNFTAFNNNLCHSTNGSGAWSLTHRTLTDARTAGFDTSGQSNDPMFVAAPSAANSWNDQLQAGSPARGSGHPTLSSTRDRLGVQRTVPSIGSRE
jgi:hypothetical protein